MGLDRQCALARGAAGKLQPGSLARGSGQGPTHSMVSSVNVPEDLRYTADHEWARLEGEHVRIGITDYAQDALGDIVYVQLPGPGTTTVVGQAMCELESTKSVSDVYAPLDGTVVEVNSELVDAPERVNEDPYGEGWICLIEPSSAGAFEGLLAPDDYRKLLEA